MNNRVALIMVDYPARARLKIYVRAEVVELEENPKLLENLSLAEYRFIPERMVMLHIEAYDWNCPQHITPRYTEEEIEESLAEQRQYIRKLEEENRELRLRLGESE